MVVNHPPLCLLQRRVLPLQLIFRSSHRVAGFRRGTPSSLPAINSFHIPNFEDITAYVERKNKYVHAISDQRYYLSTRHIHTCSSPGGPLFGDLTLWFINTSEESLAEESVYNSEHGECPKPIDYALQVTWVTP